MAKPKGGLIATVAIIALLVVVIGVGIINFTSSGNTLTEMSVVTQTATIATTLRSTSTRIATVTLNNDTTVTSTQSIVQTFTSTRNATTITSTATSTVTQKSIGMSQLSVTSITLYGGAAATNTSQPTSSFQISFNNPNSSTYITSIILDTQGGLLITAWDSSLTPSSAGNLIDFSSSHPGVNALSGSSISFFTFYPVSQTAVSIPSGKIFQYIVLFASGSLIEGNITAQ